MTTEPLCGSDWLKKHINDYSQAYIENLTLELSIGKLKVTVRQGDKRKAIEKVIEIQKEEVKNVETT